MIECKLAEAEAEQLAGGISVPLCGWRVEADFSASKYSEFLVGISGLSRRSLTVHSKGVETEDTSTGSCEGSW